MLSIFAALLLATSPAPGAAAQPTDEPEIAIDAKLARDLDACRIASHYHTPEAGYAYLESYSRRYRYDNRTRMLLTATCLSYVTGVIDGVKRNRTGG